MRAAAACIPPSNSQRSSSPLTVEHHLKSVFDEVGGRSRRDLVAQIFARHYAPRMFAGGRLADDGWFADA
jgi:hypothetical protein